MPNLYHDYYDQEPREISSTYEGRHVSLPAELLNSPAGGGVVVAKDPVTFGNVADGYGVGVAFISGSGTDQISIDTEGIWCLDVVAVDDEGASPVRIGDIIFINRTTCVLSKISSDTTNIVFGYALDAFEGGTHGIAVKVHWDPWYDIYRDYLAGGAAEDALLIDVDDAREAAAGYGQGLQVTYRQTGDKTVAAEVHNVAADMFVTGDVMYAYCYTAYVETSGNPDIGALAGVSVYMTDPGDDCQDQYCLDLGMQGGANSPINRHCFIRMRNHTAAELPAWTFRLEGTPHSDYLLSFESASLPYVAAAPGAAQDEYILVDIAGADRCIRLFATP